MILRSILWSVGRRGVVQCQCVGVLPSSVSLMPMKDSNNPLTLSTATFTTSSGCGDTTKTSLIQLKGHNKNKLTTLPVHSISVSCNLHQPNPILPSNTSCQCIVLSLCQHIKLYMVFGKNRSLNRPVAKLQKQGSKRINMLSNDICVKRLHQKDRKLVLQTFIANELKIYFLQQLKA